MVHHTIFNDTVVRYVIVEDTGTLVVPQGVTLEAQRVTLEGNSTLEVTGGTLVIKSDDRQDGVALQGVCSHLSITDGASVEISGVPGGSNVTTSWGGNVTLDVNASRGIRIENSSFNVTGGAGFSPSSPWTSGDLDGHVSAGGNVQVRLNLTHPSGELVLVNSTFSVAGGGGGKAPNGSLPIDNSKGLGGGFTNGGNVTGHVGSGGAVDLQLAAAGLRIEGSVMNIVGGDGADAGDAPSVDYGPQAGAGGGGFSGGDGANGLNAGRYPEAEPGGEISGHVGIGGDVSIRLTADNISMTSSDFLFCAGMGGDAGDAGTNGASGGGGGGGYSGGGGGSYYGQAGADGGMVRDDVGSGGDILCTVDASEMFDVQRTNITAVAGDGGDAGEGASALSYGGGGGGGYSGGGGGGSGSRGGNDGGNGSFVTDFVGTGGHASIEMSAARLILMTSSITAEGGHGGDGGTNGTNFEEYSFKAGGGGGGYSAGGGGGDGGFSGLPEPYPPGKGGRAGPVGGHVGNGGSSEVKILSPRASIQRNAVTTLSGSAGDGRSMIPEERFAGEGRGRATSDGASLSDLPMSVPVPLVPEDGGRTSSDHPFFAWMAVADSWRNSLVQSYVFELAMDGTFGTVFARVVVTHPWCFLEELPLSTSYWHVRANYTSPPGSSIGWSDTFRVEVEMDNAPVIVEFPDDITIYEDSVNVTTLNLVPLFSDPDGDPLEHIVRGSRHIEASIDDGGNLILTPEPDWYGTENVAVTARELGWVWPLDVTLDVTVVVQGINDPPKVLPLVQPLMMTEDITKTLDLSSYIVDIDDPDEELTLECSHPAVQSINGLSMTLLYNVSVEDHIIEFNVSDASWTTRSNFTVRVIEVNDPPRILSVGGSTWTVIVIDEDSEVWLSVEVVDEENDRITLTLDNKRWAGAELAPNGTLHLSAKGPWNDINLIELHASDPQGGKDSLELAVLVKNINDPPSPPVIRSPLNHSTYTPGVNIRFEVDVHDPDMVHGQVLNVTWSSHLSGWLRTISSDDELVFYTRLEEGVHMISVTVSDGEYERSRWIEVTIHEEETEPPDGGNGSSVILWSVICMTSVITLIIVIVIVMMARKAARAMEPPPEIPTMPTYTYGEPTLSRAKTPDWRREQYPIVQLPPRRPPPPKEPPAPPVESPAETEAIRDTLNRRMREVMGALEDLPYELPPSLEGMDPTSLVIAIIGGEMMDAPDGAPLVRIDGRWYYADLEDPSTFMQEFEQ
jgi:hypothetical protein